MDKEEIAFSVGVELSYLDEYSQRDVLEQCEINDCTPSYSQAWRMHKADREGLLTKDVIQFFMSEEKAKELGVKPMATFVAGALAGVRPEVMGIGPVASTKKVMAKTGMKIEDFDIIEANEAFAAQSVAVGKDLGIDVDKQLNPNGGAIALGHPVGASGARILVTLLHEMQAKGAKTGLATLCIGGGMGCSTIVKIED